MYFLLSNTYRAITLMFEALEHVFKFPTSTYAQHVNGYYNLNS